MSYLKDTGLVCRGCLATDRTLTSIEKYYHIYYNIINDSLKVENTGQEIPCMCWECEAILHGVEKFRKKVLEANVYLSLIADKNEIKTLSTLAISTNQDIIDVEYTMDDGEGNGKIDIEVKEEPIEFKPDDLDYDDYDNALDFSELLENKDILVEDLKIEPIDNTEQNNTIKKNKSNNYKLKKKKYQNKYRVIHMSDNNNVKMYECVRIDDKEREHWMKLEKKNRNYRLMEYKCESCMTGFADERHYLRHLKIFHHKVNNSFVCDICKACFLVKSRLSAHIGMHYTKYKCTQCDYECFKKHQAERHFFCAHKRAVECLKCRARFTMYSHFYQHYRDLHKKFTCDYCGKNFLRKTGIIRHIGKHHEQHRCEVCNKTYKALATLIRHNQFNHVKSARELCYCVECNIQFDNTSLYNRHIRHSTKHKPNLGVPCPECGKVYNRRCTMINHFNLTHVKKTKHYCQPCDRYFLNGYRLRQHRAAVHDKLPRVKNKMCPYCARGFSTNRILENHIRTHTGERPFACACCPATFAQQQALVSHSRAIHKLL